MITNISVIGAGIMGNGIAHVFAENGYSVTLVDLNEEVLKNAIRTIEKNLSRQVSKGLITETQKHVALGRIVTQTNLATGVNVADLVVEAATEDLQLKLKIFQKIDEGAPIDAILSTNTSSISVTKIAKSTKRPDRVIGMHFMNPVPVMRLVEIVNGYRTAKEVTEIIADLAKRINKVPCIVNDYPGFIANRLLMPMINEAIYSVQQGVAGVREIDTIMKLGMAHPMGPLQLADFIGLDTCRAIMLVLFDGFGDSKYAPCPLLTNMVNAGYLGVKSGEGFYLYRPGNKEAIVSPRLSGDRAPSFRES
ncbi:MAG TPA: 3-hydroxyacyl-CoA dehydrogenase NAD-binding domain-containing protein [Puia sp.]|nr:3-hydroxyacyl-CoA dehydrogenase NAD-binding domain-containing protein [Puia sp.]